MKYLLLLLTACGATQPTQGPCFQEAYLYVSMDPNMRAARPWAMTTGTHLWNSYLPVHIRFIDEAIPADEIECFNILGDSVNVPVSLSSGDSPWVGLETNDIFLGTKYIQINEKYFNIYDDLLVAHTIAHELGHALGFAHVFKDNGSIMYPEVNESLVPSEEDIDMYELCYDGDFVSPQGNVPGGQL